MAGFLADGEAPPAEPALSARKHVVSGVRVGETPTTSEICGYAHADCTRSTPVLLGGRNACGLRC